MYAARDFPTLEDGAAYVLGFDLTALLGPNEAITAAAASLVCVGGADQALATNYLAWFVGSTEASGSVISQLCFFNDPLGALNGNVYTLQISASTSTRRILSPWARINIEEAHSAVIAPAGDAPIAATSIILPIQALKFVLPIESGYAIQDFPTANQGLNAAPSEAIFYGIDFSAALSPGDSIVRAQARISIPSKTDPVVMGNPQAYFEGSAGIYGPAVTQLVAWPLVPPPLIGNTYVLGFSALTAFNESPSAWARVNIGVVA